MKSERVLMAQAALVGGLALALLVKEFPGLVREIKIWRIVGFRPGTRRRR